MDCNRCENEALYVCDRCGIPRYCSNDCKDMDWVEHQVWCFDSKNPDVEHIDDLIDMCDERNENLEIYDSDSLTSYDGSYDDVHLYDIDAKIEHLKVELEYPYIEGPFSKEARTKRKIRRQKKKQFKGKLKQYSGRRREDKGSRQEGRGQRSEGFNKFMKKVSFKRKTKEFREDNVDSAQRKRRGGVRKQRSGVRDQRRGHREETNARKEKRRLRRKLRRIKRRKRRKR